MAEGESVVSCIAESGNGWSEERGELSFARVNPQMDGEMFLLFDTLLYFNS